MHGCQALANVDEDSEDLRLGESFSEPPVHHINETTARAVLHEDEDFVGAIGHAMPGSVDEKDNIWMAFEYSLESSLA